MIYQNIAHYRVLAKIMEDASGILYKAVDTQRNRPVAVKMLAPSVSGDAEWERRIRREAAAVSRLEHPNIARVHEFGRAGEVEFAVLEAPEGESLFDLLERERPTRRNLLHFTQQIASALAAAHSAGIVHGPLNPAAIFITPQRQIKFYDFGFPVLEIPGESEEARQSAFGKGASYVSPEQVQGASPDARSDIFSFGALLFQMATTRQPFQEKTPSETWKAILEREPKLISQYSTRTIPGMDKLADRCLRKNPERRYQEFAEIERLLQTMADAFSENPQILPSFLSRNRGRIARIAGVGVAAAACIAAMVFWWQKPPTQETMVGSQFRQATKNSGLDTDPALSTDGSRLAYASDRASGGNLDIWVQPADGGEPLRVTSDPADDREPAFSPDGQTVAFRSERQDGGIYLAPSKGGDARLVAPEGRRPRFSPDGKWIAYWVGPPGLAPRGDGGYKIFIIPAAGGTPRQIRPDFASSTYPIWSPDSKRLLFMGRVDATSVAPDAIEWWITEVDGSRSNSTGACRRFRNEGILPQEQYGIPGDWRGNYVFFSISTAGGSNIWRAELAPSDWTISAKPLMVTSGEGIELEPAQAVNGRLFFSRQRLNADIWALPGDANDAKVTGVLKRLTSDPGIDMAPSLSADGSKLLLQSNRSGRYSVWLRSMQDGKETALGQSLQEQFWPTISPDGTKAGFAEGRIGKTELFYRPTGGGATEVVCDVDCGLAISGWSRDSNMALIYSITPSRRLAISLVQLAHREKTVLLEDPRRNLIEARFSPDQRWIAFTGLMDGGSARLFLAPFRERTPSPSKEWIPLTDGTSWDTAPQWSPDGKLVYFTSTRDGHRCVWTQRLDAASKPAGPASPVAHFHTARLSPSPVLFNSMDLFVARDQILVSLGETTGNIWSVKVSN